MMGDPKRLGIWVSCGQVSKSSDVYLSSGACRVGLQRLSGRLLLKFLALLLLVIAEYRPQTGFVS